MSHHFGPTLISAVSSGESYEKIQTHLALIVSSLKQVLFLQLRVISNVKETHLAYGKVEPENLGELMPPEATLNQWGVGDSR